MTTVRLLAYHKYVSSSRLLKICRSFPFPQPVELIEIMVLFCMCGYVKAFLIKFLLQRERHLTFLILKKVNWFLKPGFEQPHLQRTKLCDLKDEDLDQSYVKKRDKLKDLVSSIIRPKIVQGKSLNGKEFVSFLKQVLSFYALLNGNYQSHYSSI